MELYSRSSYLSLPSKPGVYEFLDTKNTVLYVGKAIDLKLRVSSYFTSPAHLGEKTRALVVHIEKIRITLVESELEALLLEAYYIKKYNPKYNIRLTDNKSYVMVRITGVNSKFEIRNSKLNSYPSVLLSRRMDDPNSIYFGPFPSSSAVKLVLKTIRRVFPYQSAPNHPKRICLYNHLGLCPCPPMNDSSELRKQYKKNIRGIIRVFEGETKKILDEFEKERDALSAAEEFEQAAVVQKRINALSYITQPFHRPHEYDLNPNLRSDKRQEELDSLQKSLNEHGCPVTSLDRIECYDISHIQGTNTVASMVVFENGEKESSQYRKFKIRLEKTPDDFASMQEVLMRRLKHKEWSDPGLIVVDGGKGQVSAALEILQELNIHIPLIGLAKREETIIVPINYTFQMSNDKYPISNGIAQMENLEFEEVSLPHDSKALHLVQRIRDEAHRFAITYHRKLRSKGAIK